ncbi:MAG: hypothetical protein OXD36_00145 [Rhodobacter sp.]|nr:hypothetical protein [Rhodobacter sp.]
MPDGLTGSGKTRRIEGPDDAIASLLLNVPDGDIPGILVTAVWKWSLDRQRGRPMAVTESRYIQTIRALAKQLEAAGSSP